MSKVMFMSPMFIADLLFCTPGKGHLIPMGAEDIAQNNWHPSCHKQEIQILEKKSIMKFIFFKRKMVSKISRKSFPLQNQMASPLWPT